MTKIYLGSCDALEICKYDSVSNFLVEYEAVITQVPCSRPSKTVCRSTLNGQYFKQRQQQNKKTHKSKTVYQFI